MANYKLKEIVCPSCGETIIFGRGQKPDRCPFCNTLYWEKPDIEYRLFMMQDKIFENRQSLIDRWEKENNRVAPTIQDDNFKDFLKWINGRLDPKILKDFQTLLCDYCGKIANKLLYPNFTFTKRFIYEKALDATNDMIYRYLEKLTFSIENSFAGYAVWALKGVLYSGSKEEQNKSYDQFVEADIDGFEMEIKNSEIFRLSANEEFEKTLIVKNDVIIENLISKIKKISSTIKKNFDFKTDIFVLAGILHRLESKPKNFLVNYNNYIGIENKKKIDDALFIVYEALKSYEGI